MRNGWVGSRQCTKKEVEIFVDRDCDLEDGETNEMLVEDLLNQIYNK